MIYLFTRRLKSKPRVAYFYGNEQDQFQFCIEQDVYRPQRSLRQGYVFTPVCNFVQGGVLCLAGTLSSGGCLCPRQVPVRQVHPSGQVHPSWQVHPPQVHTPRQMFPRAVHAGRYGQQGGGIASHWNAFLY